MRPYALAVLGFLSCRSLPLPLRQPAQPSRVTAKRPGPPNDFAGGAHEAITPDLAKIDDGKTWRVINGEPRPSLEHGRRVARLSPSGGNRKGSNVAMALVEGLQFPRGTVEIDLKGNGEGQASFLGIAFGIVDDKSYEAVYFRPFNFQADDPPHRAHAVQYIAWPDHTWEELRRRAPGVYEAAVEPVPDPSRWFHARIELTDKTVSVFVDGARKPCLVVDRLARPGRAGVGLWVDSQDGRFANLKLAVGDP